MVDGSRIAHNTYIYIDDQGVEHELEQYLGEKTVVQIRKWYYLTFAVLFMLIRI